MKYNVNNFVMYEPDAETTIIQNQYGIIKIQNEEMSNLFRHLDNSHQMHITKENLEGIFLNQSNEAIEFLEINRLIEIKEEVHLKVDQISIYTDDLNFKELIYQSFTEKYKETFNVSFGDVNDIFSTNSNNELAIVILTSYNRFTAKKIRDHFIENHEKTLSMNYVYNGNFYMNNLYNFNWKNPCHICNIGQIESQLRINNHQGLSYQQMIDMLYSEFEDINIETPLLLSDKINMSSSLINYLTDYIHNGVYSLFHPQNMNEIRMIDLTSSKEYKDNALHWEMCDCYE